MIELPSDNEDRVERRVGQRTRKDFSWESETETT